MTQEYGGIALLQYRRIPCTECTAALALFIQVPNSLMVHSFAGGYYSRVQLPPKAQYPLIGTACLLAELLHSATRGSLSA